MSGDRELDVVVFGATGFAGRLVAAYLASHAPGGVRIGLAGRSAQRLADVRAQLGAAASAWPLLVADSADPVSVAALARAARVVVTAVGPYRGQGLALVEACAAAGTDYADLCGEVLFIRDSIDHCHDVAAGTGARIVHGCGFDSIPSDLGVLLLHHAARADDAGDLQDTTLVVTALKGGVSGGTLASMMGQQDEVRASAERRRVVQDPYALSPDRPARPNPTWAASVISTGSATTVICGCGWAPSSWPASTPAWCAAATPCRAGPTDSGSATGRSPGSVLARPRPYWAARSAPC